MNLRRVSIILLTMALYASSVAQSESPSACPTIIVIAPSGPTNPGDTLIFTANVSAADADSLKYEWTVSAGTIVSGFGTPSITVQSSRADDPTLHATVRVGGLDPKCASEASAYAAVIGCRLPITIDEFGRIPIREEMARLDIAALELRKSPDHDLLFLLRFPATISVKTREARMARIRQHLTNRRNVPAHRIHMVPMIGDEHSTLIYLVVRSDVEAFRQGVESGNRW